MVINSKALQGADKSVMACVSLRICGVQGRMLPLSAEEDMSFRLKQGWPHFCNDLRVVDEEGHELPRNGQAQGALQIRGHNVVQQYHKASFRALFADLLWRFAEGHNFLYQLTEEVVWTDGKPSCCTVKRQSLASLGGQGTYLDITSLSVAFDYVPLRFSESCAQDPECCF